MATNIIKANQKLVSASPSSIKGKAKAEHAASQSNDDQRSLRQIDQLDQRELGRHWGPHLVPLQVVIHRTTAQVFRELQIVAETSPSLDDFERKKRIIDYVIHSRRQIIKLLVLVKWSANAAPTHKIMSIVGFLQRQNHQFERTVNILKASKDSFYAARLRNFDLATALQIITLGHPRLPQSLTERFATKPRLTDAQVIQVMEDMNEAIRYRLARASEILPKEFKSFKIADGRVTFTVEKLFECSATLGGAGPDAIWYLLHLRFLFPVRDPHGNEFPHTIQGEAKEHIIQMANSFMAPPDPTPSDPEPKPPERPLMKLFAYLRELSLSYQLESLHFQAHQLERSAWADHTRIFIAHDRTTLTLHYWLYARPPPKLVKRVGQKVPQRPPPIPIGSMTIKRKIERTGLTKTLISDFLNGYPLMTKKATDVDNLDGDGGASYTKRLQLVWVPIEVAALAIPPPPPTVVVGLRIPPPAVHVPPKVTPQLLESFMIRPQRGLSFVDDGEGAIDLEMEIDKLDLEYLMLKVIRAQMDAMLLRAYAQLVQTPFPAWDPDDAPPRDYFPKVELVPWDDDDSLSQTKAIRVVLHAQHVIQVNLDRFSGKFDVLPVVLGKRNWDEDLVTIGTKKGSIGREFVDIALRINANPTGIKNLLIYFRSEVLMREIEGLALRMEIRSYRASSIPLDKIVIVTKPKPGLIHDHVYPMFTCLQLIGFKDYYMVVLIKEVGLQCSLVALKEKDGSRDLTIEGNVEVLVPSFRDAEEEEEIDKYALTPGQLSYVYQHCMILAAIRCLSRQFYHFSLPFKRILPIHIDIARQRGPFTFHPSVQPLGLLVLPVKACFKPSLVEYLFPNLAVRVSVGGKFVVKVELQIRFKDEYKKSAMLASFLNSKRRGGRRNPNNLVFDRAERVLVFESFDVERCWDLYLKTLIQI